MAKVTQIDYQNALYDIEDADAQQKISDLQTAMGNTYTKSQVDAKFDNYYDKNQVDNKTKKGIDPALVNETTIKSAGSQPIPYIGQADGFVNVSFRSSTSNIDLACTLSINGYNCAALRCYGSASCNFSFPYTKGQDIRVNGGSPFITNGIVSVIFFPYA